MIEIIPITYAIGMTVSAVMLVIVSILIGYALGRKTKIDEPLFQLGLSDQGSTEEPEKGDVFHEALEEPEEKEERESTIKT